VSRRHWVGPGCSREANTPNERSGGRQPAPPPSPSFPFSRIASTCSLLPSRASRTVKYSNRTVSSTPSLARTLTRNCHPPHPPHQSKPISRSQQPPIATGAWYEPHSLARKHLTFRWVKQDPTDAMVAVPSGHLTYLEPPRPSQLVYREGESASIRSDDHADPAVAQNAHNALTRKTPLPALTSASLASTAAALLLSPARLRRPKPAMMPKVGVRTGMGGTTTRRRVTELW
jgi:hypothetical protein